MKILSLNPGSPEWLTHRMRSISATDCAAILGVSKWDSIYTLWQKKQGLVAPTELNDFMREGMRKEPLARAAFIKHVGIEVSPKVIEHPDISHYMCSLDGLSEDFKTAVEIKCGGLKDHQLACKGEVPKHYMPQLQFQLLVTGLPFIYYFSYQNDNDFITIKVARDEVYIKNLHEKCSEFYISLQTFTEPQADYIKIDDNNVLSLASETMEAQRQSAYWKRQYDQLKDKLVEISGRTSSLIGDYRLTKSTKPGNVDYSAIPELKEIDVNLFRKAPIESWRLSKI